MTSSWKTILLLIIALIAGPATAASPQEQVTLNFVNADIDQVARAIGAATGRTIIVDPRVKGQINIVSEQPVSQDLALKTLQSTLRMQGFTLLEDHGVLKVVPEADAKFQGVPMSTGAGNTYHGDQMITQVFHLKYESANNILPDLRPLISPNNTITAYPAGNALVVTDYADNVKRLGAIIASLDTPNGSSVEVVTLKNGNAAEISGLLQKALDPSSTGGNDATLRVFSTPDLRTNSLVLRASNAARMEQAKSLVEKLDAANHEEGNMHVVHLRNADSAKLAQTLRGMMGGGSGGSSSGSSSGLSPSDSGGGGAGGGGAGSASTGTPGMPPLPQGGGASGSTGGSSLGLSGGASASFSSSSSTDTGSGSGGGMIQADIATNSLIITAPEPIYRSIRRVIEQLDSRRAQVYIESLILEITTDRSTTLGVQWQGGFTSKSGNNTVVAGTNYNSGGQNIFDLTTGALLGKTNPSAYVAPATGLNVGLIHQFGSILGLGGLLQAIETLTGVNVLSTPNLITLDNEEAKIVIGQNVPFITGSYAQTGTTATVTPFQTYDRQDVGITLRVKPQIAEGGIVRLQIYQESSSVVSGTENNPGGVTTNKRSLQSTVLCDNGQIIVLGGLLQDSYNENNSKIPFLADLPWVGGLFRYEGKERIKTNLMVFLRPVIVFDAATSAEISQNRYDLMRGMGKDYRSDNRLTLDTDTPVIPGDLGIPQPDPAKTLYTPTVLPSPDPVGPRSPTTRP